MLQLGGFLQDIKINVIIRTDTRPLRHGADVVGVAYSRKAPHC